MKILWENRRLGIGVLKVEDGDMIARGQTTCIREAKGARGFSMLVDYGSLILLQVYRGSTTDEDPLRALLWSLASVEQSKI